MSGKEASSSHPILVNNNPNKDENIHHPSEVIGGWGPMQQRIFIILTLIYVIAPLNNLSIVFTAPKSDFYCVDNEPSTGTSVRIKNSCRIGNYSAAPACQSFDHDKSFHKRTVVNQFDLVCEKSWYPSLSQSIHQIGYAISGLGLGIISDRFGRFFCAKLAISLEIFAGFAVAFSPNVYAYLIARFFVGIAAYGRFLNGYVLIAEWVGPKLRGRMAALYESGWTTGKLLLPIIFFHLPDYVFFQIGVSLFEICVFIPYLLIVKESPRWQLTHGRYPEAERVLKKAAKEKGMFTEEQINQKFESLKRNIIKEQELLRADNAESPTILDIMKIPQLRRVSFILYLSWFSLAFESYATFLNVGNLGGSVYWNVFFLGLAEIVAIVCLYFLIRKLERKVLLIGTVLLKTFLIMCVFAFSFHDSLTTLRIIFYTVNSISQTIAFHTIYIYTTESFPTTMRQTSIGTCSIFARMGSIIAPFIKELTEATHLSVAIGLFCFLSITNVLFLMLLPDTTDVQLPDNIFQTKAVEEDEKVRSRRASRIGSVPSENIEMITQ
jgi:MFS family permease